MGFTTPCFIRKNTPEIKKKLEELGYKDYGNLRFYGDPIIIYCNVNHFFTSPFVLEGEQYIGKYNNFIDCGDNEDLFLAVAALRDDTDKNQWFFSTGWTDYAGNSIPDKWVYCDQNTLEQFAWVNNSPNSYSREMWKKATIEEIIEHFKK